MRRWQWDLAGHRIFHVSPTHRLIHDWPSRTTIPDRLAHSPSHHHLPTTVVTNSHLLGRQGIMMHQQLACSPQ